MTSFVKIWGSFQTIFSIKVFKNYLSLVYGQKLGKNLINGVNLVKIGHFSEKFLNFGGKNDVIGQNFGKVVKNFFHSKI